MQLDVLIIAPHPDDAEISMGGTILNMLSEGMVVGILDLTDGEPTPHGSSEIRAAETVAATNVLHVPWRQNLGLTNRSLQPTLEARAALAGVFRRVRPRWLFAPYWIDAHPDHVAATQLVEEARFWSKLTKSTLEGEPFHPARIFNYYSIHLKQSIQPAFVVDISQHWATKLQSLQCYESQFIKGRDHERPPLLDRARDFAAYWGHQIGTEYGEPFAAREPVGLLSLASIY